MTPLLQSVIVGAGGVWAALAAAVIVVGLRRPTSETLQAAAPAMLLTLALQALHFSEEFATGFQRRFFPLLGQAPWPDELFVAFNAACIACWALSVAAALIGRWSAVSATLFWFLGLCAIVNGLAHPVLAVVGGGYFPGLATAPFLGVAGVILVRRLTARPAPG